jgi:hypothetical protein
VKGCGVPFFGGTLCGFSSEILLFKKNTEFTIDNFFLQGSIDIQHGRFGKNGVSKPINCNMQALEKTCGKETGQ